MTIEQLFAGRNFDIAALKARMVKLMADERLPFGERTMTFNSRLAQELAAWAVTQPGGGAIHDALFKAYFLDGLNLAEVDVLLGVADQINLEVDEARRVTADRSFRQQVDADWQRSAELGITGVPTFVVGGHGVVGAQPYENLAALVEAAGAKRRAN